MQALEKIAINKNWITLIILLLLLLIAVLKSIDKERLKGYVFAFFNKNFIDLEVEENPSFFNSFNFILFLFSAIILSLTSSLLLANKSYFFDHTFSSFLTILVLVLSYLLLKKLLDFLLVRVFIIKKQLQFYTISKISYLYAISFGLFVVTIITTYSGINTRVLYYTFVFLLAFRFVTHIIINKKLIFSKLFYFILYICAFEIAPLFLLFKLIL
ncbi:DUF4271 domain-containing protein [Polaribacter sp.]|uniref:DUF4271 domain-containing protein n=1 Tax=Polaribacter sp. TaxID=1920175 RepID=UPI003F6CEB8F